MITAPTIAMAPGRLALSAAWARVAPRARMVEMPAADPLSSCARPWPTSTSMARPAMTPKTASAIACGLIACCTWPWMMSRGLMLKASPVMFW